MRKLLGFIVALSLAGSLSAIGDTYNRGTALVYRGEGACADGCSEAAAEMAARLGFQVRYVTLRSMDTKKNIFEDAVLWIQPGGNAIKASKALGGRRLAMIRSFVEEGGAYVGFCAGAFLTDRNVADEGFQEGLGIIPWSQEYYPIFTNGDGTIVKVSWGGSVRHLYFNGGGTFKPATGGPNPVEVLASYEMEGIPSMPAAVATTFGKGRVVVTGAHPEATFAWRSEDNLPDPDGLDFDLAEGMIRKAVGF